MKYQAILLCLMILPSISFANSDNTKEWINILSHDPKMARLAHPAICINMVKSGNGVEMKKGFGEDRYTPLTTKFIISNQTDKNLIKQLAVLKNIGYVKATSTNKKMIVYRFTPLGLANSNGRFSYRGGCFITGKREVSSVLEYKKLDDMQSGLEMYKIIFEVDVKYEDWADNQTRLLFKARQDLPVSYAATFIKGSKGWYLDPMIVRSKQGNRIRKRGAYWGGNLPFPSTKEVHKIALKDKKFIEVACRGNIIESSSYKNNKNELCNNGIPMILKIHHVLQNRGNTVWFTYTVSEKNKAPTKACKSTLMPGGNDTWRIDSGTSCFN